MQKLKDRYDLPYAHWLADRIGAALPDFPKERFIALLKDDLEKREFLARQDLLADALYQTLALPYPECIAIFRQILGPELAQETGMFSEGGWLWPIGRYVERFGLEDVDVSLVFIEALTRRFTGEFAMRPLLQAAPDKVLPTVLLWSTSPNVHVRRLASECVRIHLPWAKKLTLALTEFERYTQILSNLKNDPSRFVQKSVGNNLNDLYKECPEKAEAIIQSWLADNPGKATLWIIRHGTRSCGKTRKTSSRRRGNVL